MIIDFENCDVAEIRRGINDGKFYVSFRQIGYDLKAKNWKEAKKEATELLNKKFPNAIIVLK